ncbi:MAG: hypothetical protein AAGE52_23920 [Myxococcota bacterium]
MPELYCDQCNQVVTTNPCRLHPENMLMDLSDPDVAAYVATRQGELAERERDLAEHLGMVAFALLGTLGALALVIATGGRHAIKVTIAGGFIGAAIGRYVPIGRRTRRALLALAGLALLATPFLWLRHNRAIEEERAMRDAEWAAYQEEEQTRSHERGILRERCEYDYDNACFEDALRSLRESSTTAVFDPQRAQRERRIGLRMLERGCELGHAQSCAVLEDP